VEDHPKEFVRTAAAAHLTRRRGLKESCPTVLPCPTETYVDEAYDETVDQKLAEVEEEGPRQ